MPFRHFLAGALALGTVTAYSEDTAPGPLEEVVVTAGFREHRLMDSGGSVSVVPAEVIESRGARHLEDTLATAPNVNFAAGGSRARFVQMRGVGDLEQFTDPKHYPSVGIVMDGIELSNVATAALLLDTEQVEILRGPQGTRFGASALAGIVNIRGRDPGEAFEAQVETGVGNLGSWMVSAAAGGALSEHLGARFAIRQNSRDGFMKNAALRRDDTQDLDELAMRGRLVWQPRQDLSADLTFLYVDTDNGYDAFTLDNSRTSLADEPGKDAQEVAALAGRVSYDLPHAGRVQLLTTWTTADELYSYDEDWVFRGFCDGVRCDPAFEYSATDAIRRERDQFSTDLRWLHEHGRARWAAGAYVHVRDEDMERQRFGVFDSRYDTYRYALYGELELALADRLTARLGARGEAFNDTYRDSLGLDLQSNDTFWSGNATLEYVVHPGTLLYTTLARGAKPGGVNTGATSVAPFVAARFQPFIDARRQFDTETLFSKEVGIKGHYFGRLDVQLAAFHMTRKDAQLESWLWDAANFIFVGTLDNVDDAENYGVELALDLALTRNLSWLGRVGYLETEVERMTVFDLDLDAFRTLRDRDQTKAPRWTYHFGLRWQPLPALTGTLGVEGRSRHYFGYHHDGRLDGYTVLNASLAYRWRQLTVRGWARNLTNNDYAVHGLYFANDPRDGFSVNRSYEQRGEPRVYALELSYAF